MKPVHRNLSIACCIFVSMLMAEISVAQVNWGPFVQRAESSFAQLTWGPFAQKQRNPTVFPYGGVPDSSLMLSYYEFVPLSFSKALFENAHFRNRTYFFVGSRFDSLANFRLAHFERVANFEGAHFDGVANFNNAFFDSAATFLGARFARFANFKHAGFKNEVDFAGARFDSAVSFWAAHFDSDAVFINAYFGGVSDFKHAYFDIVHLGKAKIAGEFLVGSENGQKFDFTRTIFFSNGRLVLNDLVELKIQPEKFKHISFGDTLNYFLKKDIIENLKIKSFANDNSAQFELNYIFSKSTMYQEQTGNYEGNKWHEIRKWPKWFVNTIYYWTMGLGYRPFRLIWWVLAVIIIYTAVFAKKIPARINAYISKPNLSSTDEEKKEVHLSLWETLLNCAYFSVMVFFTFRLKRDILTFFDAKEKRLIVGEWIVGFVVYVAFLTLSKSGSILHNLKELFVG